MEFKVEGEYPVLKCIMKKGETIKTSAGAMSWMDGEGFEVEVTTGGLMKGLGRMFSGESLFFSYYTAKYDNQEIAFASSLPGSIVNINMDGKVMIGQKSAFLASEKSVEFDTVFTKKLTAGMFGGEGFILQKFSGSGELFLEADGSLFEYDLKNGESLLVDQGHVFLFEESVRYEIETVKGVKNVFFGGEGLFLVRLIGPGKVTLQSMPIANLAARIIPFVPQKSS